MIIDDQRRRLLLLRHAKSSWLDVACDDHDRPLNGRGAKAAILIAPYVIQWAPQWIGCSTAQRTRATLLPIIEQLATPARITLSGSLYEGSVTEYLNVVATIDKGVQTALLVGHNPTLQRMCAYLMQTEDHGNDLTTPVSNAPRKSQPARIEKLPTGVQPSETLPAKTYPTGALAVFSWPNSTSWQNVTSRSAHLEAFIRPRDLDQATGGSLSTLA